MDEDRIEGAATNLGGKVKDAVGSLVGDSKTQAEGKADQVSGTIQNAYGSAKDGAQEAVTTLGNQLDTLMKERPIVALLAAVGFGFVLTRLMQRR